MKPYIVILCPGIVAAFLFCLVTPSPAAETAEQESKFRDPEDGWFDVSGFLDTASGFVPIIHPITEPAVGYGGAGGLLFIDRPSGGGEKDGFGRPNLTFLGGMGTENGTWGFAVGDIRHWLDDRLKSTVSLFNAQLHLKHYGIGDLPAFQDTPLNYQLEPLGGRIGADFRLFPEKQWWAGLQYSVARNQVTFEPPPAVPPEIGSDGTTLLNASVAPTLTFDSRDTIFTPSRGTYLSATGNFYSTVLGGDRDFQTADLVTIHYLPLHADWILGLRADAGASFGNTPFYLRPAINLRGVTAQRYQGQYTAQMEAELRWQFWRRFSVLGFGGTGTAWNGSDARSSAQTVVAGGFGFRYELARRYRLHAGIDVAFGPDEPVFYIQVGSAWSRP